MVKKPGAQTLAGEVYERLQDAILGGRYDSGERLRPAQLCAEYDVSTSVVREALTRLAERGLAVLAPNQGFRVVRFEPHEILELSELRVIIETAALRLSIERGDVEWESSVLAAHHRLKAADVDPGVGSDHWFKTHRAFHLTLLSGCGNTALLQRCSDLVASGDLYLRWSKQATIAAESAGAPVPPRDTQVEHAQIVEAALARDVDAAVEHYRAHLELTAARVAVIMGADSGAVEPGGPGAAGAGV